MQNIINLNACIAYPEKEDAVVIVDEVTANGEKWYNIFKITDERGMKQ